MIRFTCSHCGGRIAVNPRHTGRLVRCPDCGGITHPLAQQLAASAKDADSAAANKLALEKKRKKRAAQKAAAAAAPICANCGRSLGKLQTPRSWKDQPVCQACHDALSADAGAVRVLPPGPAAATFPGPATYAVPAPSAPGAVPTAASSEGRPIPAYVVDPHSRERRPREFSVLIRGIAIGLCATAAALYLINTILQSLSLLVIWGVVLVAIVLGVLWMRRKIALFRAKVSRQRDRSSIQTIARD